MIKPEELMIGNYLHDREGRLCKVNAMQKAFDTDDELCFSAPPIDEGVKAVRPHKARPITEDELYRLGFTACPVSTQHGNGYDYQPPDYKTEQHDFLLEGKEFFLRKTKDLLIPKGEKDFIVDYTSGWCAYKNEWYPRCPENSVPVEIKYVHQLQNLVYSLTGEQLK
jgi:hypothetical protein